MCSLLWAWLAISVAVVCGAPAGQSTNDFLAAERRLAEESKLQPREVALVGNVKAQVDTFTQGRIRNVMLTSDVPRVLSINPNFAHLNLGVVAALGDVVVEGEVNISSSTNSSAFFGNVTLTYGNMSASGMVGIIVVQDVIQVTQLDLMYSPQNRSVKVSFNTSSNREAAVTFFEDSVEQMVVDELDRRVSRQLNEALKGVSSLQVFGDGPTMNRVENLNPVGNVNLMVDSLLAMMLPRVPATVSLDNVDRPFKRTILFMPVFGQLSATNGTLSDLKTLRRTSDVFLNVTSTGIRLTGAMGLATLKFAYNYDISVLDMGPTGKLEGSVGNNSLTFALKITYDGRGGCTVHIEELRIERLDDFKIKVTGLGILNWLASSITTSVVNDSKDKIVAHIEDSLNKNLKNAADKIGFCNVLQGM